MISLVNIDKMGEISRMLPLDALAEKILSAGKGEAQ